MADERRDSDDAERRTEAREAVTLVVDYDGADDLLADFTENLSTGGTFVHTERRLERGTVVSLVLSFPGLLKPLRLEGEVRWCRGGGEGEEPGIGIEFGEYDDSRREQLEQLIEAIRLRDPAVVGRTISVLVVEDNPHVAGLIREGLGQSVARQFNKGVQFTFRVCADGRDALKLLGSEQFDALIIDIYLPVIDGASVIAHVRADEQLRHLPVIAVSAGGPSAREEAMQAGANFFLDKPMRLRQVVETMTRLLNLDGKGGPPAPGGK